MHHGQAILSNGPEQNEGVSEKRHGLAGFASRQRLGVALALAIAGMSSCASGREARREAPQSVSVVDPTLSFMNESQRKVAKYILSVPCDDLEKAVRGSRSAELVLHFELIQSVADLQRALKEGDQGEILKKIKHFMAVAERMEEGEAAKKFRELADNPDTAFEVLMVQDYMVPVYFGVREFAQLSSK